MLEADSTGIVAESRSCPANAKSKEYRSKQQGLSFDDRSYYYAYTYFADNCEYPWETEGIEPGPTFKVEAEVEDQITDDMGW